MPTCTWRTAPSSRSDKISRRRASPTIDGHGMIVLPGFVETHWHMWNTLLRSMSGDKPDLGYFRTTAMLGQKYRADDMYQGTRLACAEAINNGITIVHDWCHNIRGPEYADADLQGAARVRPARAVFLWRRAGHAEQQGHRSRRSDAAARRLGKAFARRPADARPRLARAGRQQSGDRHSAGNLQRRDRAPRESSACRSPSMPAARARPSARSTPSPRPGCSARTCSSSTPTRRAPTRSRRWPTPAPRSASRPSPSCASASACRRRQNSSRPDIPVGLSVDTVELSGNADMFGIMKVTQNAENGIAESEFKLDRRGACCSSPPAKARAPWGSATRSARSKPASAPT